jgi:hypothetical protein
LLAGYVAIYVAAFLILAWGLRKVVDGFKIKTELKVTGVVAICAVIPWLIFNDQFQDINRKVFPFSTLSLLIAIMFAFIASTVWPLWRSIFKPPKIEDTDIPENLENLASLIGTKEGFESFRKFLTAEFSVENLLFYADIEDFRKKIHDGAEIDFQKQETKRLFAKYIIVDSPFQVNLPNQIVQAIEAKITSIDKDGIFDPTPAANTDPKNRDSTGKPIDHPTIFDEAQRSIYNLMDSDSFPRYKASETYREFVKTISGKKHKNTVLKEMNII